MKSGFVKIGEWWLFGKRTLGFTFYPFIFIRRSWAEKVPKSTLDETINHERIHIRQQIELLIIPFYLWYIIEFLVRIISSKTVYDAYMKISFEREAYNNDSDPEYLQKRKFWGFLKYL